MEQVAALVAQKKEKIEHLENKRIQTEQEKEQVELNLEDLNDEIKLNYSELNELIVKCQLGKDSQNDLGKLIAKNSLMLIVLIILSCGLNPMIAYLIIIYIAVYIPKYIKLIHNIREGFKSCLGDNIKTLRKKISILEKDRDRILVLIRKLNYALEDIDAEKKVMQDILNFVLEKKNINPSENTAVKNSELNLTRTNPCI